MNKAYVFVETAVGRSREIAMELLRYDWVDFAERVTGPYDIVAMVTGYTADEADEVLSRGLSDMDGVIRVVVCPIHSGQAAVPAIPALVH